MIRDEFRNHYNEMKRTKLEQIASDCATAMAVITPRVILADNLWSRRSLRPREQRPHALRAADAS